MKGRLLSRALAFESMVGALFGLAACSSDEPTASITADSGDRDAFGDAASSDVSTEVTSTGDAATETNGGRSLTAGTCSATRWNARYGSSTDANSLTQNNGSGVA